MQYRHYLININTYTLHLYIKDKQLMSQLEHLLLPSDQILMGFVRACISRLAYSKDNLDRITYQY